MQPDINAHMVPSGDGDGDGHGVAGPEATGRVAWSSPVTAALEWDLSGGALTVRLGGEVCTWSVRRIEPVLRAAISSLEPEAINIDLSEVTFFDGRGVSVLIEVSESARQQRRACQIMGTSDASRRVLAACGLELAGALDTTS